MDELLLSVYYPHSRLNLLANHFIKPIIEKDRSENRMLEFDYFLSTYKGENVAFRLYPDQPQSGEKLSRMAAHEFNLFKQNFPSEKRTVKLPLNQLFLDIPVNC